MIRSVAAGDFIIHADLEFVTEIEGSRPRVVLSRKVLWSVMFPEIRMTILQKLNKIIRYKDVQRYFKENLIALAV